jgi:amino acid adenylation domain-containing protein
VDRLLGYTHSAPDRTAISCPGNGAAPATRLSRAEWHRRALLVAAGLRPRSRVLVLLPSGPDFFVAFVGVLTAGAAAVPVPPPVEGRDQFVDIALDADVDAIVTTSAIAPGAQRAWARRAAPEVRWLALDHLLAGDAATGEPVGVDVEPDDLALLQYTSGSTGEPKGVAVTHRVLTAWLDVFAERVDLPGASVVTWVTAHHVLGLCLVLLGSRLDGEVTLLAAEDVLADPARWLRAIAAADRPVVSGAPPFGYQRCVDTVTAERRQGLDLSGWEVAVIGSERISPRLLDDFAACFGEHGFRASAFFLGYGTTETMMATAHRGPSAPVRVTLDADALEHREVRPATADGRSVDLLACGSPGAGIEAVLVDPDSRRPVAAGQVGELWLRGAPIAGGYWRRPEATERTFRAALADGSGPHLRTGDLAFRHDGEIVPCGRLAELIVIRGRNVVPDEVEAAARAADPALAAVPVAAFSLAHDRGERLVVLVTGTADAAADLARRVRTSVIARHEVEPYAVHVVPEGAVPLTATGKVRRGACRTALLAGALRILGTATAGTPAMAGTGSAGAAPETAIRRRIGAVLGVPWQSVAADLPLIQLGLDSMRMIRLRADLDTELGVLVPMDRLAGHTVHTLAAVLAEPGATPTGATRRPVTVVTPEPAGRHEPFPLTDLQHAYLVGRSGGYQLSGVGTHFYVEYDAADLDADRLYQAWCRLVARHDMLRAVIAADGEQRVPATGELPPMIVQDLRYAGPDAVGEAVARTRSELSHQVFPADTWPLFDIRVDRLPGGVDRVYVSLDLLVLDVWSLHILSGEWHRLYAEPGADLPPLSLTFRDYVRAAGTAVDTDPARRYWQDRLDTLPLGPELPLCLPPASLPGPPAFRRRSGRLDPAEWRRLTEQAVRFGVTATSVLLAAYATVLGRWSRRSRFVLNLPTFNRLPIHPEVGSIVGDFTSLTLLEVDLGAARGVLNLATSLQAQLWQDLAQHDYDGVRVLRDLARHRGQDGGLLAPVVFSSASGQAADGVGELPLAWLGEQVFGVSQTPQVLLDHQVVEHADGLDFNWDSVDELFADGVLDDMFAAYVDLVGGLAAGTAWHSPAAPLPAEQARLVAAVNDTAGELPDGPLYAGIANQARRAPDRTAVITGDGELTYAQLWRHAAALARELHSAGVARGELVAVCLPKSAAQVVAVLGVQLAGGAYLPVDPALPEARRRRLLALGRCRLAVGDVTGQVRSIQVDLTGEVPDAEPPAVATEPDDLAYVIFTSGSTGEPKGVAVSHRAARNTCVDICSRFGVGAGDRVLGLSSLSFDLSVWDVFGVLGVGGALVLPEPEANRDPARWWELIHEHHVTVWNSVPALAQMLADYPATGDLRLALLSGDWIPLDLPGRIRAAAPDCRVVSLGGATEAAIWSIHYEIGDVDPAWESIPYGWPLRNQRWHVRDDRGQECPVHVTGELYIAGAGLADGYFGDDVRTAAAFRTDPATGERCYRTGDLGRRRPDGAIEFLGREDFQVKIGGHRIELGEIETALLDHPAVRSAVVAATGDRHHRRLAACVVVRPDDGPRGGQAIAPEFVAEDDRQRMIFDELDRIEFKVARHGVRGDLTGQPVPLAQHPAADVPTRRSHRRYADRPVPITDLAGLLALLRSHDGPAMAKYAYASAGNSYAVQTYVYVAGGRVTGLADGMYYHDPDGHRLVPAGQGSRLGAAVSFGIDQAAVDTAGFLVFLVAARPAIEPLYGRDQARDLCLIEAGLMAQLLETGSPDHHIGLCQVSVVGGADEVRESCGLGADHEVLHALLGGALLGAGESAAGSTRRSPATLGAELRTHLAGRLPEYMVPARIVTADRLPLTPTGKIDRTAVARLVERDADPVDASPPATDLEASIAEVFRDVLGLPAVGVHAGFFDLGADSTAIVRVYRLLKAKLDRRFPLTAMFEHATVHRLATALAGTESADRSALLATAAQRAAMARSARRRRRPPVPGQSPSTEGAS